jgi:hypothetical protein
MHLLLAVGLAAVVIGAVLLVVAWTLGSRKPRARRRFAIGGASAVVLSISIFLALALAETSVCTTLGGRHNDDGCQDEWGGNGDNDESNNDDDPWPWTN